MRRIEMILYKHYENKYKLVRLEKRLKRIESNIKILKIDLEQNNIEMKSTLKAIDYSQPQVSGSIKKSSVEIELERAFRELENSLSRAYRNKYKVKNRIKDVQNNIENIDIVINQLNQEEIKIIEMKYSDILTWKKISKRMYCSTATIYRKRDRILKCVSDLIK